MIPVCTAQQVRALDEAVIQTVGIPGQVLMEIAGRGAADTIHQRFPQGDIAVLCGPGNNGGDGYVAARWLALWGRTVRLWGTEPRTDDARTNRHLCEQMNLPFMTIRDAVQDADIVVDALLGTGQRSAPHGDIADAVRATTGVRTVVAIDIPTGVQADTGQNLGEAVQASITITLGRHKTGLFCAPGCNLAGEIVYIDIGLDLARTHSPELLRPEAQLLEQEDILSWRPAPPDDAAKWDRGHVAIMADGGAAVLAAHGAFRGGAGLVTLLAPTAQWKNFHGLWPEVILAEPDALDPKRHDVVVVGPGFGVEKVEETLTVWNDWPKGVVADADALSIFATHNARVTTPSDRPRIITPHAGEAARMLQRSRAEVESDRFGTVRALSGYGVAVLKGPHTLIGPMDPWVNHTGCSRLATAGTGDVLAGLIGGLVAAGVPARQAAAVGVWEHGQAGELMKDGGTASDLVSALQELHK